jgi:hypothetical protein
MGSILWLYLVADKTGTIVESDHGSVIFIVGFLDLGMGKGKPL